jgi:hypothetical protein
MKTLTKVKGDKTRSVNYENYPETWDDITNRFSEDEITSMVHSTLDIRYNAIIAADMNASDDAICAKLDAFRPGQGHGGSNKKQSLIASILEADDLRIFTGDLLSSMKITQLEDILSRLQK